MRIIGLVIAIAWAALAPLAHAAPVVIKFSHVVAPDTPKGKAAERFRELAEKYTGGAVKVEVYPNSQLFKDREELEALQRGAVQMLAPSVSKFGPLGVREFELFDLPYLFPDRATVDRVTDGEIGRRLFAQLEPRGIKGLAYWDNGFKQFSANRPLRTLRDFRGLRLRIQSSKVLEAMVRELGALPQVMAFSEVYTALQQGVVDGTENPLSNLYTQKMHEVQKHLTISDHGYLVYAVVTNKKFWDGLPAALRAQLEKALAEATRYEREIAEKENEAALAAVRASGKTEIYVLPEDERSRWRQALMPVHRRFEAVVGADNLRAVYAIAAESLAARAGKNKKK
ncbi:MAG TPA: TRAP transporter substrate-binding protein [Burkholderiales bacterium]|jgi:C4-dicarboxylate-binding protein DctP|nr:TRAP transporter substrate-binding protein [Burkholderiales bacterium]